MEISVSNLNNLEATVNKSLLNIKYFQTHPGISAFLGKDELSQIKLCFIRKTINLLLNKIEYYCVPHGYLQTDSVFEDILGEHSKKKMSQIVKKVHNFLDPPLG